MADQLELAAAMAGAWWAERLATKFDHARTAFGEVVARLVLQELRGECYWDWRGERHEGRGYEDRSESENDYDPHNLLIPALEEALPGVPEWELRNALPRKHSLAVYADRLVPKEGYGNWTAEIPVQAKSDVQDPQKGGA